MADTDEDYLGQDDEDEPLARRPVQMPQSTQATSSQSITGASMAPPQVQPTSITSAPKQPLDMPRTGGPLDMSVAPTRPTPAADRLSGLEATPSGVSQKHGVLGGLLKGLDTAGSFLLPELAVNVPGSTLNRQHQINEAAKEAQGESILGKNAADVLHTGAETGELGAKAGEETSEGAADTSNAVANQEKADVDKANSALTPVTTKDGRTAYLRQEDVGKFLGTEETNQSRFDIEKSKETSQQMLQNGRPVTMDQLAARATQEGDQSTLQQVENFKKTIAAAGKQEPGSYMPVPDANGNTVGWVNPKSREFVAAGSIGGGAAVQAAGGANGALPAKPSGQTESRMQQAETVVRAGDNLISDIKAHKDKLGNAEAIVESAVLNTPWADPETAQLRAEIGSFIALNPAMHGFRGANALQEFQKIVGGIPNNPDALIAAIQGIQKTAGAFNTPSPAGGEGGSGANPGPSGLVGFAAWKAKQGKPQ